MRQKRQTEQRTAGRPTRQTTRRAGTRGRARPAADTARPARNSRARTTASTPPSRRTETRCRRRRRTPPIAATAAKPSNTTAVSRNNAAGAARLTYGPSRLTTVGAAAPDSRLAAGDDPGGHRVVPDVLVRVIGVLSVPLVRAASGPTPARETGRRNPARARSWTTTRFCSEGDGAERQGDERHDGGRPAAKTRSALIPSHDARHPMKPNTLM